MILQAIVFSINFILVLLLVLAWIFSNKLLHPRTIPCEEEKHIYVFCGRPSEQGLKYEEITFQTFDNLIIKGWYIPKQNSKSCIILIHGISTTRTAGMRYARTLHNEGFNILTFDLRNFGESGRSLTSFGYYERLDIFKAIDFLEKEQKIENIGVLGFSMGSGIGIISMSEDNRIKAGVFESSFSRLENIIAETAKKQFHLPRYPLIPIVMKLYEIRGKLKIINPEDRIAKISPRPVYLIHGTKDKNIHYSHSLRLFEKAKNPKQLWIVEGGRHVSAWNANKKYAEKTIIKFFKKFVQ